VILVISVLQKNHYVRENLALCVEVVSGKLVSNLAGFVWALDSPPCSLSLRMPALLEVGTGLRSIRSSIDVAVYVMVDRRSFSCNNNPSSRHTVEDRAHHAWLVVVGAAAVSPPRLFSSSPPASLLGALLLRSSTLRCGIRFSARRHHERRVPQHDLRRSERLGARRHHVLRRHRLG